MSARPRDAETTRSSILIAARTQFGDRGFERTTIRSIASAAGVDPALVMHYFGTKAQLFAEAAEFDIAFPDLSDVAPDRVADVLIPLFVAVWGPQGPLLPLLRAATTNGAAADALLSVFTDKVTPALSAVAPDRAAERAALVGSQLLGIAVARNILALPPLADMDDEALVAWLRPVLAHYLSDTAPAHP
ncbi:TetR family transcriptional regulator [Mycolicibacterium litorale]|uniref:TetR family transcriptional regulator n=1 Tax=Mycolicibacterium litorale TaxID=758802 RepID=A0A6S6P1B9_9MYCO|nr:TetR family transcriptional regulator [Mycolicibacterium litorale]BCI52279.1 TetR family transcriptional regulator [Mycolicibacterium litorale]